MSHESQVNNTESATEDTRLSELCRAKSPEWESELSLWLVTQREWLLRRCSLRLGNDADAEDALQEVSLKVFRSFGQFEGRSSLRTWVTRIADNHCNTVLRRRYTRALTDHIQFSLVLFEENRIITRDAIEDQEASEANVEATMDQLNRMNREMLHLRFFNDLSLEEIATSLNLTLSATKMRLYRAMDAFKQVHETMA